MLSSLGITRILAESSALLADTEITAIEYYRKERTVQLYVKGERRNCLTMSFHPQRSGFYILPAGRSRIDTPEKYRPFAREAWGGNIVTVKQHPNDRIIEVEVTKADNKWYLIFEILGPNGNLWFVDVKRQYLASLRNKKFTLGGKYKLSSLPAKLDPKTITMKELQRLFSENPDSNPVRLLEKNLYGFDYYLAGALITDTRFDVTTDIEILHSQLLKITSLYHSTDGSIYAYHIKGKNYYYPLKITGYEPLGRFKTISEAQRKVSTVAKTVMETDSLRDRTIKSIESWTKKNRRLLKRLDSDIEEASGYERYRQYADLLKINLSRLKRGMTKIEVQDLFEGESTVTIILDPKSNGPENIENYSKRYRKGKEGLEILKRRKDNIEQETQSIEEALRHFENNFDEAQNVYPELMPTAAESAPTADVVARPYKEYQTSTGLTILVGKSGGNNDRTTFEYAKPYELWFHASQCPGSHVVMKFPHKNFVPSRPEIEETASAAAYFSKARGSAKVPVSYTQKKYVRKPRKAKPGLVTIEREKTIIVEPRELSKNR
jgi:predicted ribosome quality control (RQC) complex YloA/Tae2 family protein